MNPSGVTLQPVEGVKHLIAVGSGKGGVGKTTVSVNLAVALAAQGHKVGLMDADVYGPNVPLMMDAHASPHAMGERIVPLANYGVKLMSMGFMSPGDKPLIWRGPMLHSVMQQFLRGWPGANSTSSSLTCRPAPATCNSPSCRPRPIAGAIIVTTPQRSGHGRRAQSRAHVRAGKDADHRPRRKHELPDDSSGERIDVFGEGGGQRMAAAMNIPFLVELPLDPKVRIGGDSGQPAALDPAEPARRSTPWRKGRRRHGRPGQNRPEDHPGRLKGARGRASLRPLASVLASCDEPHLVQRRERQQFIASDLTDHKLHPSRLRDDSQSGRG